METLADITENWLNGNRKDVVLHLANSHPVVTANLVEWWRAWVPQWWSEWATLRSMLGADAASETRRIRVIRG